MKKGFTLIETLVAIAILLIALAGPLTIAAKGLTTAYYARDQITAFYLAQEGVEYIRNFRDAEALVRAADTPSNQPWLYELINGIGLDTKFTIDAKLPPLVGGAFNSQAIKPCPGSGCPPLQLDSASANSTYGYLDGSPTQFTREITISAVPVQPNSYRITSTVSWKSTLPDHSFTLVEDITNWEE